MIVKYIAECRACIGNSLRDFLENKTKLIIDHFKPYGELEKYTQFHYDMETRHYTDYTVYFQIFVKTIEKEVTE